MRWIVRLFVWRSHVFGFAFVWVIRRRSRRRRWLSRIAVRLLRVIRVSLRRIGFGRTVTLVFGLIGSGIGLLWTRIGIRVRLFRTVFVVVVNRVHNGRVRVWHRMTQFVHLLTRLVFHVFWGMSRKAMSGLTWVIGLTWRGAVGWGWRWLNGWVGLHVGRFGRICHPFGSAFVIVGHVFAFRSLVSRIWMRDVLELRLFIAVVGDGRLVVEHRLLHWLWMVCRLQWHQILCCALRQTHQRKGQNRDKYLRQKCELSEVWIEVLESRGKWRLVKTFSPFVTTYSLRVEPRERNNTNELWISVDYLYDGT